MDTGRILRGSKGQGKRGEREKNEGEKRDTDMRKVVTAAPNNRSHNLSPVCGGKREEEVMPRRKGDRRGRGARKAGERSVKERKGRRGR